MPDLHAVADLPAATSNNAAARPASNKATTQAYRLPVITRLSLLLEIGLLLIVPLLITSSFGGADSNHEVYGAEAEYLTSSAYLASKNLDQLGYIPHWEPYLGFGEPLIDSPFSFVTNPLSIGPSLVWGAAVGIRVSIILEAILAAIGGWALGRVLGFGWLARLLLGLLCLGKGNMLAMVGTGYFQLGGMQAYFPWILAGFIGVLRLNQRRWPIVLTAVMFTLMFWAGNIWYTLPILIMLALLTASHVVQFEWTKTVNRRPALDVRIDRQPLNRVLLSGVLTLGISMMIFLPVWINQLHVGHPNDLPGGIPANVDKVLHQFFFGDQDPAMSPGLVQLYYSFVMPWWFAALIFVLLPPIKWLWQPQLPGGWRVWSIMAFMVIFCTVWGLGGNPIFVFLYNHVPLMGQWRFVGRALAVATFGIGVLAAARVDGLWRVLTWEPAAAVHWKSKRLPHIGEFGRTVMLNLLTTACIAAAGEVNARWPIMVTAVPPEKNTSICLDWLRQQYPNHPLSVFDRDYYTIYAFLRNNIRAAHIAADFHPVPNEGTLYHPSIIRSLPEYGIAWETSVRMFFTDNGYTNLADSPAPFDANHCLWYKADALRYAFTIPLSTLSTLDKSLTQIALSDTSPLSDEAIIRTPDQIGLYVNGQADQPIVATIQELAYPGWGVQVDGIEAKIESIGGQIGVLIPVGATTHTVDFYFRPALLYIGAVITLLSILFSILYLLDAERLLPPAIRQNLHRLIRLVRRQQSFLHRQENP